MNQSNWFLKIPTSPQEVTSYFSILDMWIDFMWVSINLTHACISSTKTQHVSNLHSICHYVSDQTTVTCILGICKHVGMSKKGTDFIIWKSYYKFEKYCICMSVCLFPICSAIYRSKAPSDHGQISMNMSRVRWEPHWKGASCSNWFIMILIQFLFKLWKERKILDTSHSIFPVAWLSVN